MRCELDTCIVCFVYVLCFESPWIVFICAFNLAVTVVYPVREYVGEPQFSCIPHALSNSLTR